MNLKTLLFILALAVIIVGGGYYLPQRDDVPEPATPAEPPAADENGPTPPPSAGTPPSSGGTAGRREPIVHSISMVANTFSPDTITTRVGDTVVFVNNDTKLFLPASDVHPIHQTCPGFDAKTPVEPDGVYSHTFTVAKTCPFHDH